MAACTPPGPPELLTQWTVGEPAANGALVDLEFSPSGRSLAALSTDGWIGAWSFDGDEPKLWLSGRTAKHARKIFWKSETELAVVANASVHHLAPGENGEATIGAVGDVEGCSALELTEIPSGNSIAVSLGALSPFEVSRGTALPEVPPAWKELLRSEEFGRPREILALPQEFAGAVPNTAVAAVDADEFRPTEVAPENNAVVGTLLAEAGGREGSGDEILPSVPSLAGSAAAQSNGSEFIVVRDATVEMRGQIQLYRGAADGAAEQAPTFVRSLRFPRVSPTHSAVATTGDFAIASKDGSVLWYSDAESGYEPLAVQRRGNDLASLFFSEDFQTATVSYSSGEVLLLDVETGRVIGGGRSGSGIALGSVAVSPQSEKLRQYSAVSLDAVDGGRAVILSQGSWESETLGETSTTVARCQPSGTCMIANAAAGLIAIVEPGGMVKLVRSATGEVVFEQRPFNDKVMRVYLANSGKRVAMISPQGFISIWDVESGAQETAIQPEGIQNSWFVGASPDLSILAYNDNSLVFLNSATGREIARYPELGVPAFVHFSDDGLWAVVSTQLAEMQAWVVSVRNPEIRVPIDSQRASFVAEPPGELADGRKSYELIAAHKDGRVSRYELRVSNERDFRFWRKLF